MRAKEFSVSMVTYRRVVVDGIGVFYREAGPKDAPTAALPFEVLRQNEMVANE